MASAEDHDGAGVGKPIPAATPTAPQVQSPTVTPAADAENPTSTPAVASVLRRWKREDLMEKSRMVLRASALLFSLLASIVMASNKHGDWKEFDKYEEYRYFLAIAILSFLYALVQVLRRILRYTGARDLWSNRTSAIVDFTGDQISAYLLISASSAAIPITNRMREGADNIFTDASSSAISMAFFAFLALALSALISGFKLSKQSYI